MSLIVVDASVGEKRFLPEVHSAAARRLRDRSYELHVPGLFDVEVGNLPLLPVVRHPDGPLVRAALDLAEKTQRTVYDCLCVALAAQLGGQTVTADQRLHNSLSTTAWANRVLWVGSV